MAEPRDPPAAENAPVEPAADRRLSDSNRAWLGKIVDNRYRVIEVIGRGGMGVVYRVEHLRMGKIAAMKVLHRDLVQDPDVQRRFETEAAAVSRLNHPHTVQVFDFGNAAGNLYLIMELVRGLDLGRVVSRDGPLTWARAAPLFVQICGALQEAHELGIVHRDLKPENVLITRTTGGRDYAKVLDFGLAKLDQRTSSAEHTDKTAIVGTPYFMAPEQIRGETVDPRTDIYSLGAMMYEILTGTHVYDSATSVGVLTKHLTSEPEPLSARAPRMGIPIAVDQLCRRALAKSAAERWTSAAELAERIEEIYAETVADGPRSGSSRGLYGGRLVVEDGDDSDLRLRRSDLDAYERGLRRRRVFVVGGATVLALGAAGVGAYALTREPPPATEEAEPNDDPAHATMIAAARPVSGMLGKRLSTREGDRDHFVVEWPAGSRRVVSVKVTAPPNIDIHVTVADRVHALELDDGGVGDPELVLRRRVEGPVIVRVDQTMASGQKLPVENVSDAYTVAVTEELGGGEIEPNGISADATPLLPTEELRGHLESRGDIDLLRWTGPDGSYHVVVRADGLPMSWRVDEDKPRTPGAATITLRKGALLRLERTDRAVAGPLPGREAAWSVIVTPAGR